MRYTVMSPDGMTGPSYVADDPEVAAQNAEADGFEILDIQDNYLVVANDS
jgi:hypothetical protein